MFDKKIIAVLAVLFLAFIIAFILLKPSFHSVEEKNMPEIENIQKLPFDEESDAVEEQNFEQKALEETSSDQITTKNDVNVKSLPIKSKAVSAVKKAQKKVENSSALNEAKTEDVATLQATVEEETRPVEVYKDSQGDIVVNKEFSFRKIGKYFFK